MRAYWIKAIEALQTILFQLINGDGRELAWSIYAQGIVGPGLPSYYQLRWNTRSFHVTTMHSFYSPPTPTQPITAGDLLVFFVRPWFGKPRVFYTVHVCVDCFIVQQRTSFESSRAYGSLEAATADFFRHKAAMSQMRWLPSAQVPIEDVVTRVG
jgi:hypothetical protein